MTSGPSLVLAHTSALDPGLLAAAHDLLWDVFADDIDDSDWEHALGGLHAVVIDGGDVVGHAALVQRRLLHGGRALRCGYVEGVAVHGDRRRRGVATVMMDALEAAVGRAYDVGGLGASDNGAALYRVRGWQMWRGALAALTPTGIVATPDEARAVHVLPVPGVPLDLDGELTCDWRDGSIW